MTNRTLGKLQSKMREIKTFQRDLRYFFKKIPGICQLTFFVYSLGLHHFTSLRFIYSSEALVRIIFAISPCSPQSVVHSPRFPSFNAVTRHAMRSNAFTNPICLCDRLLRAHGFSRLLAWRSGEAISRFKRGNIFVRFARKRSLSFYIVRLNE